MTAPGRLARVSVLPRPARVLVVTLVVLAGVALACQRRPLEDASSGYDLVSLLDLATVRQGTGLIDLGTPQGRTLLEHGWSWDEVAESSFAWGVA